MLRMYKLSLSLILAIIVPQNIYSFGFTSWLYSGMNSLQTTVYNGIDKAKELANSIRKKIYPHPHVYTTAYVRQGNELGKQEQNFLVNRKKIVHQALEKLLGHVIDKEHMPNIGLCFSGGSYRAMIETLGSMQGAHDIGLLDGVTYISGLSGSTWMIAPWVSSRVSLDTFAAMLRPKIKNWPALPSPSEMIAVIRDFTAKKVYGQDLSLVDIYGAILANTLLTSIEHDKHDLTLSHTAPLIDTGSYPMPICAAVNSAGGFHWFEFTPYEIGSHHLAAYIPTWSFGREFQNGASIDHAPEQTLGYLMGIWGSAFCINFETLTRELGKMLSFAAPNLNIFDDWWDAKNNKNDLRLSPAYVHNFTYGLEKSPIKDKEYLTLVDGGHDVFEGAYNNIAIQPLLRPERKLDVIIICDSDRNFIDGVSLYVAEQRARKDGLPFPPIDYTDIDKRLIQVFADKNDPNVPIIIYIPGIKNPAYGSFDPTIANYTSTMNFEYEPEQTNELSGLTKFTLAQHKQIIIDTIETAIALKKVKARKRT